MRETFRAALARVFKDRSLSAADKAHVERWLADGYAKDRTWDRLATAARVRGVHPTYGIYESIIREALFIRNRAESMGPGIDTYLRERQQQRRRHLELAQKAEDLADYFKWTEQYSGISDFYMRFLQPVEQLQEFHRKEAKLLRQRAGRVPSSAVRVSRQDKRGNRKGLRKLGAFIQLMHHFVLDWISEIVDYRAIALLAEIAFPEQDIDPEQVRKVLQPSTRSGRKGRRALAAKKS
jgi:hypothetical protein